MLMLPRVPGGRSFARAALLFLAFAATAVLSISPLQAAKSSQGNNESLVEQNQYEGGFNAAQKKNKILSEIKSALDAYEYGVAQKILDQISENSLRMAEAPYVQRETETIRDKKTGNKYSYAVTYFFGVKISYKPMPVAEPAKPALIVEKTPEPAPPVQAPAEKKPEPVVVETPPQQTAQAETKPELVRAPAQPTVPTTVAETKPASATQQSVGGVQTSGAQTSNTVTDEFKPEQPIPLGPVSLSLSASSVKPGETITVSVSNGNKQAKDWVGIFAANSIGGGTFMDWKYLNGSKTAPASGIASANVTLTAPAQAGDYEVRFYANDSTSDVRDTKKFAITPETKPSNPGVVKAFPTAEGLGATETVGGRGGRVIRVTNLNDSGPGSFRDAIEQRGKRIVVFDVSGTIDSGSKGYLLKEEHSYLTIAGQTSPGGIQLKGNGIAMAYGAHDIVIRHLRIRPGARKNPVQSEQTTGIAIFSDTGPSVYNVIIDHCSIQWADDDSAQFYNTVDNATYQWCLIANPVDPNMGIDGRDMSANPDPQEPYLHKGRKGFISRGNIRGGVHHSVLANPWVRAPALGHNILMDWRNNIVYNANALNGIFGQVVPGNPGYDTVKLNLIGNLFIPGPDSLEYPAIANYPRSWPFSVANGCHFPRANGTCLGIDGTTSLRNGGTKIFNADNRGPLCPNGCVSDINRDGVVNDWDNGFADEDYFIINPNAGGELVPAARADIYRAGQPFEVPDIHTHSSADLESVLLAANGVGATKPRRDQTDIEVLQGVANRTGRWSEPYFSNDYNKTHNPNYFPGGPWPDLAKNAPATAPTDGDKDGMSDAWERSHNLNPADASDGAKIAANGYTNVENYLNELAGDVVP